MDAVRACSVRATLARIAFLMSSLHAIRLVSVLSIVLCILGCSLRGRQLDRIRHETDHCNLRVIEATWTDQFATSDPVSAEEASMKIVEEVHSADTDRPEKISVSLSEVRAAALANNLDLEVELFNPEIAAQGVSIARGRFDAVLGFAANRLHLDQPIVTPPAPPGPGIQFNSHRTDASVQLPNRTGGSVAVERLIGAAHDDGSPEIYDSDWRFSISQPLLRNAGVDVNTAPIRIAKYSTLQADALARLEVIRVLADSERQFWRVWAAERELEIREQQLELAERQRKDIEVWVKSEAKAGIEITRAEAGIAQRVGSIISAEANLRVQERELKRIVNWPDLPVSSSTAIETTSDPELIGFELDTPALAELALRMRPEMKFREYELAQNDIQIAVARNSLLPLLTVDAFTTVNGVGGSLGQANDVLNGGQFADHSAGLSLVYPFPNSTARGLERQARLQKLQTVAVRNQLIQLITQQVYDATTLFQADWKNILAARNNVRSATKELAIEQQLFEANEQNRTTTEVLNAAARLAAAQSAEIQAIASYQISRVNVVFATGTLLGYGQVHWHLNPECRSIVDEQEIVSAAEPNGNSMTR